MSEAIQEPAETVQPEAVADSADRGESQGADDYWGRVASDPDFAADQIRKRDAKTTEMSNRLKSLEQIENMVKLAGGSDQLLGFAQRGARIDQIPGLSDIVESAFKTGQLQLPQATGNGQDEDEPYIDEDVRVAIDPLKQQIAELKSQLAGLNEVASAADLRSKEAHVKENIDKALERFSAVPEIYEKAKELVGSQYAISYRAAQNGDSVQASVIDQLAKPGGSKILDSVLFDLFEENAGKLLAARNANDPNESGLLGRETDARVTTTVRPGPSELPQRKAGQRVTPDFVMQSFAAAKRNKGL